VDVVLLPEPVTLQGGGLQKRGGLHLALWYQVHDVLTKNNFRIHQGRDQESLLVRKSKGKIERQCATQTWMWSHLVTGAMSVLISRVFMVKKQVGGWFKFTLGNVLPFVRETGLLILSSCPDEVSDRPGVKSKARAKFIERIAKQPAQEGLSEKNLSQGMAEV
jgi:hypothetical protein